MLLDKITDELTAEFKRLVNVLELIAKFEGTSDVRLVAEKIRDVNIKRQIHIPCYETGRSTSKPSMVMLAHICGAQPDQDLDSIVFSKTQNYETKRYESIYISDFWVKASGFAHYLDTLYTEISALDLAAWIPFLEEHWPLCAQNLKLIIESKTNPDLNKAFKGDLLEAVDRLLDGTHPHQANKLASAINAWYGTSLLVSSELIKDNKNTVKQSIKDWLDDKVDLGSNATNEIAKIANWRE